MCGVPSNRISVWWSNRIVKSLVKKNNTINLFICLKTKNVTTKRLTDTATGLQNTSCHRDIIKQRSIDFLKHVADCF
jgi:hypothetical protein